MTKEDTKAPVKSPKNKFAAASKAKREAVNGPPRANPKPAKSIGKKED